MLINEVSILSIKKKWQKYFIFYKETGGLNILINKTLINVLDIKKYLMSPYFCFTEMSLIVSFR